MDFGVGTHRGVTKSDSLYSWDIQKKGDLDSVDHMGDKVRQERGASLWEKTPESRCVCGPVPGRACRRGPSYDRQKSLIRPTQELKYGLRGK